MAPSHYLNQCWNIVNWAISNKVKWNINQISYISIQDNAFENIVCEMKKGVGPHGLNLKS